MTGHLKKRHQTRTPTCTTGPSHRAGTRAALILIATLVATATATAHEILYLTEGRVYLGEILDGRPHGEGRMIWPSDAVHTGTWVDGTRHGTGTYRESGGVTYIGEFRDGERTGNGRLAWPDGRSYDGTWHTGMRHGNGVEVLPGGLSRRCTWRWGDIVHGTCSPDQ